MATNKLLLNIPDILTDCVLRIEDTSVYAALMPYVCPTVQVTVPGFKDCVTFNNTTTPLIGKGFILNLTACDLELQQESCGTKYNVLPDGIYTVRYSMSPNDRLYVEYDHLRVSVIKHKLKGEWNKLKLGACEPRADIENKFKELMIITSYIDAAKANADYCLDRNKSMALYNYAKKKLNEFSCKIF